jgi:hypothetical protein
MNGILARVTRPMITDIIKQKVVLRAQISTHMDSFYNLFVSNKELIDKHSTMETATI